MVVRIAAIIGYTDLPNSAAGALPTENDSEDKIGPRLDIIHIHFAHVILSIPAFVSYLHLSLLKGPCFSR